MTGEYEPKLTPKDLVDTELGDFLKNEPTGSPVIKALGDFAAQTAEGMAILLSTDPDDKSRHTALYTAVTETIRNRGLDLDSDLYDAGKASVPLYLEKYRQAVRQEANPHAKPNDNYEKLVAATNLKDRVKEINTLKAAARRRAIGNPR